MTHNEPEDTTIPVSPLNPTQYPPNIYLSSMEPSIKSPIKEDINGEISLNEGEVNENSFMKEPKNQDLDGDSIVKETASAQNTKSNAVTINSNTAMIPHDNNLGLEREGTKKLKKAVFNIRLANSVLRQKKKNYISEQSIFPLLTSALAIPSYHFNYDHGREPPAIILEALKLEITDSSADMDGDGVKDNGHIFRIELQYGPIRWVIYRRLIDFLELRANMHKRKFQGKVKAIPSFPSIFSYTFQRAFSRNVEHSAQLSLERRKALEAYLKSACKLLNMQMVKELFEFLEMSGCSFKKLMGWKGKEGFLSLRNTKTNKGCFPIMFHRWSSRWVIVRDSYIAMCKSVYDTSPIDVYLFNQFTSLNLSSFESMNPLNHRKISIIDHNRQIDLKGESYNDIKHWSTHINLAIKKSMWTKEHRYNSFAPIRENCNLKWYVDAAGYFYDVSEAILHAKDTIYIADWWLSPELYLRRPPSQYPSFRLDRLLKKKALQGVDIFVIVYKEIAVSLPNNSAHTKQTLKKLHPRIKVLRHPDRVQANGTWFWAHHEKICIIDNKLAFVGGLDLCFGRYDDNSHRVADYNPLSDGNDIIFPGQDYSNARIRDFENVEDYNKELIDRMKHGRMPWHDIHLSLTGVGARDVARHFIERWNFIKTSKAKQKLKVPYLLPQAEFSKDYDEESLKGSCRVQVLRSSAEWSSGIELENSIYTAYIQNIAAAKHFIYIENQFFVSAAKGESNYSVKNQIAKALVKRIIKAHKENSPFKVIIIMPLMPAFQSDVHEASANTIRLVMQWQYQSICRGDESVMGQLRKEGIEPTKYVHFHGLRNYDFIPQSHQYKPDVETDEEGNQTPAVYDRFTVNSPAEKQAEGYFDLPKTRSNSQGNVKSPLPKHLQQSIKRNESSFKNILDAFKGVDADSRSSDEEESESRVAQPKTKGKKKDKNKRSYSKDQENNSEALEMEEKEDLPSYVEKRNNLNLNKNEPTTVIPAGIDHSNKTEIKLKEMKLKLNINKPEESHSNTPLEAEGNKPIEAENHEAASQYVTELVYIHSKLMIVDDRVVICGSANINDRSMLGFRDSEVAIIVEDQEMIPSTMAGKEFQVAKFAHTLRCTLFKEHLGLLTGTEMVNLINFEAGEDLNEVLSPTSPVPSHHSGSDVSYHKDEVVKDPLSESFNHYWFNVSEYNTKAFRKVFRCVPDDTVTNWDEYKLFIPNSNVVQTGHPDFRLVQPNQVKKVLSNVRGHLVDFPTKFLEQVSLEAGAFSAENIIPVDVFI
ncbi:phospholipase D/nuclease [Neoconidiobolus thromboides FSU 785]|nr:phospholipase D/nuclease [Neoconidiobolus thromboides FSU 785]